MGRIVLRNALVHDGSGADGVQANVLIEDGAVMEVSPDIPVEPGTAEELDCTGCAVAPGFGAPARFLGHYVRDEGLMSWGEGIRRLTGLPAEVMGWRRRGRLAAGTVADVVAFRPDELADRATYDAPIASPAGIRHVLVAGRFVVRDGRHTGETPGRILRRDEPE